MSDQIFLSKVSLGLLVPQAQLARRESPAAMESRGQQERRVNQVSLVPASQQKPCCPLETVAPCWWNTEVSVLNSLWLRKHSCGLGGWDWIEEGCSFLLRVSASLEGGSRDTDAGSAG